MKLHLWKYVVNKKGVKKQSISHILDILDEVSTVYLEDSFVH